MSVAERISGLPVRERTLPNVTLRGAATVMMVAGICLLPVLLYVPLFTEAFMKDEGLYASSAQALLHGQVPYRDFFDNKPPLIYGWYTLSFLLFGQTVWAPRLLVSLLISLATLCVYFNGRLIYSHRWGVVAAAAFAISIGITKLETNANTEYFMLLPMSLDLFALLKAREQNSGWWYLLAGVAGGVTVLTKTTYALPLAFLFGFAVWSSRPDGPWTSAFRPAAWQRPALMIAGSFLAFAAISTPIALAGGFPAMIEALTYYSWIYSDAVSLVMRLRALVFSPAYLLLIVGPWLLLAAGGAYLTLRAKDRSIGVLLVGWWVSGIASIVLAGRFYDHYWVMVLPAMALLIPPAAAWVYERRQRPIGQFLVIVVLPLSLMSPLGVSLHTYLQPTPAARHQARYNITADEDWETRSQALGQWLQGHTKPGDYIYNLGFQAGLYFYSDRTSPTRFYFDHAFGLNERYEREAIHELSENPPVYVVDSARYEPATAINYYSYTVHDWVVQNYDYVGKVEYADIWRLKETSQ